jgi:putative peptidoglycan lipid II flippase
MATPVAKFFRIFKRSESYRFGFIASSLLNVCAKALGFLTTILTAFLFGSSAETDLFFFAIVSTAIISSFIVNLDGTIFIPRSMKLRNDGDQSGSNDLLRFIFCGYFLMSLSAAVIIIFFPLPWMKVVSRFEPSALAGHTDLIRLTGPWLVVSTLNFFLVDVINSFKRFSLPMYAALIGNLANVLFILLTHRIFGIQSIIGGCLIGGFCQFFLLLYSALRLSGCGFLPIRFPLDRAALRYIGFSQGAYLCSLFVIFVPLYLLSGYPQGMVSALGYGQRIIDLVSLLLISQFSNVLAIKLNELHLENSPALLSSEFNSIGRVALFFIIPAAAMVSMLSYEAITVLFVRGEFTNAEAMEAAGFTRVLVFLLPLLLLNTMVARLVMATGKIDRSFIFQAVSGIITGLLCAGSIRLAGPYGYPYAMIIAYMLNLVTVGYFLRKWITGFTGLYQLLWFGLLICLINGAIIPIDAMVKQRIAGLHPVGIMAIVGMFHALMYGLASYALRIYPPFNDAVNMRLRRG